jgi:uncharacterized protein YkwD
VGNDRIMRPFRLWLLRRLARRLARRLPRAARSARPLGLVLALVTGACAQLPPVTGPWPVPGGSGDPGGDEAVTRFVSLLHDRRAREGCPRLVWNERVAAVAVAHSRDMDQRGYFSHVSPEGRDPFHRLEAAGIRYARAAENIAHGTRTGDSVFAEWVASPGHRSNMLDCRFTHHGVGREGVVWTHVLIRPQ